MVEVLESGSQEVVVPQNSPPRSVTPTDCNSPKQLETTPQIACDADLSKVQRFYAGQSVFITGGTGFIGKLLIQKLLRSCSNLAFIYLLVRPKKGKDAHQRAEELFDDPVFDKLKEEQPKFRHQIVAVAGDCSQPDLGLSHADRATILREVSIIFHVAATVRFDENLKLAVAINVQSPRDVIKLCKEMTQLKACIHVSTAYANCTQNPIDEKIYDAHIDGNKLISLVENMDEKLIDDITKPILGQWPNTYTFTKAVAENIIKKEASELPIGIFRPAIVIATYQDPIRGWIDNMYGPTGVAAGAGSGLLRSLHCDGSLKANVVPGDWTVNAMITSAWDVANVKENNKNSNEVPIYNYTNKDNPITWDELKLMTAKYGLNLPTCRAIWYYSFRNNKYKFVHLFYIYFLHLLPALLVDAVTFCVGKKPRLLNGYKRIHKFMEVINHFTLKEWQFSNEHVRALADKLDGKDKNLFPMDMKDVNWDTYFQTYIRGIRVYLLKDPLETLPQARIKWQRMYWMHQATKVILMYGLLRFCWTVLNWTLLKSP